jgi:hypothetical protein
MAHGVDGGAAAPAWALLGDFCSLHRWVPSLSTCRLVEGAAGQPGCVRHCAGPVNMAATNAEDEGAAAAGWSRERLVGIDHAARWYSYELVESNKGFGRYRATVRVEPDPGAPSRGRSRLTPSRAGRSTASSGSSTSSRPAPPGGDRGQSQPRVGVAQFVVWIARSA